MDDGKAGWARGTLLDPKLFLDPNTWRLIMFATILGLLVMGVSLYSGEQPAFLSGSAQEGTLSPSACAEATSAVLLQAVPTTAQGQSTQGVLRQVDSMTPGAVGLGATPGSGTPEEGPPLPRHQEAMRRLGGMRQLRENNSCWSRNEMPLFLEPLPQSPALQKALAAYLEMQEQCTSPEALKALFDSVQTHKNEAQDLPSGCKYVLRVWPRIRGIGSQMTGLSGTFTWALLTNRSILQSDEDPLSQLLCNPFRSKSWMIPHSTYSMLLLEPAKWNASLSLGPNASLGMLETSLAFNSPPKDVNFLCDKYQHGTIARSTLVQLRSDEWFVPGLHMVPAFKVQLEKLFPGGSAFAHVARFLLLPSNRVWLRTLDFFGTYLAPHTEVVGVQLSKFQDSDPVQARVMGCLTSVSGILPAPVTAEQRELVEYSGEIPQQRSIGVLLSSLRRDEMEFLVEKYTHANVLPANTSIGFYSYSWEREEKPANVDFLSKGLIEIVMLGLSTNLLKTDVSANGYVAAGLYNRPVWTMNIVKTYFTDWKTNGDPVCKTVKPEPCFNHLPAHWIKCPGDAKARNSLPLHWNSVLRDILGSLSTRAQSTP